MGLHEMSITAIRNDADYEAALARIELLFDEPAGTPESDELNLLARLVVLAAEDIDQKDRSYSEDEAPPLLRWVHHSKSGTYSRTNKVSSRWPC